MSEKNVWDFSDFYIDYTAVIFQLEILQSYDNIEVDR